MAIVAGAMTLRQDMKAREKFMWFALLLWLMGIEIRAVKNDRAIQDASFTNILLQTMGGEGAPEFLPTHSLNGTWPVKVINMNEDKLPLMNVTVDISSRPANGPTVLDPESISHPRHFDIGTIPPDEMWESPIVLVPGRYYFSITTRRNLFYEKINIDPDAATPSG
jgi:hypothetical protein